MCLPLVLLAFLDARPILHTSWNWNPATPFYFEDDGAAQQGPDYVYVMMFRHTVPTGNPLLREGLPSAVTCDCRWNIFCFTGQRSSANLQDTFKAPSRHLPIYLYIHTSDVLCSQRGAGEVAPSSDLHFSFFSVNFATLDSFLFKKKTKKTNKYQYKYILQTLLQIVCVIHKETLQHFFYMN